MKPQNIWRTARLNCVVAVIAFASTGDGWHIRDDSVAPERERSDSLVLTIRSVKRKFCRVEPIVVECELVNISKDWEYGYRRVWGGDFDPRSPNFFLHVSVSNRGKKTPLTRHGVQIRPRSYGSGMLPPGERITWRYCINSVYDMTADDEYVVSASVPVSGRNRSADGGRDAVIVRSQKLPIEVSGDCPSEFNAEPNLNAGSRPY